MESYEYYVTYHENKYMYKQLEMIQQGGSKITKNVDFFFVHQITMVENLPKILKDGVIKLVKYIPIEKRALSGPDELDYVYTNIQFSDLNNLLNLGYCSLILHPQLAFDFDWIFNNHWAKYPTSDSIFVYESDSLRMKEIKLSKIKEYIRHPTFYEGTPLGKIIKPENLGKMSHEVLFTNAIPLDKYLIGVIYQNNQKSKIEEIKDLLKKYPNATFSQLEIKNNEIVSPHIESKVIIHENII